MVSEKTFAIRKQAVKVLITANPDMLNKDTLRRIVCLCERFDELSRAEQTESVATEMTRIAHGVGRMLTKRMHLK